jgi:dipeptide transport system permease protein
MLAVFADLIAPYPPGLTDDAAFLLPPFWQTGGSSRNLLGTDAIGRDILSRLIYGARLSLLIGLVVVSIAVALGTALGLMAGFFRGVLEMAILRLMDILLTLPSLLLAIVIVAILGPGMVNAMLAVAAVVLPHYVRIARAAVITETAKDYVTAAKIGGAGPLRLMLKEVLPNCMAPLIVQATLGISTAILDAAALGYLGLGAQPPLPEWGTMLADAREFVLRAWWVVTFPGLMILIAVLAFNLVGDGLRDALDPKLKS